jgi:hypothetical protein
MCLLIERISHSHASGATKPFGDRGTIAMTKIQRILSKDRAVKKAKGK